MARNERQSSQTHSFASRRFALNQPPRRTTGMAAHRAELGQKRLQKCDEVVSAQNKIAKKKNGGRRLDCVLRAG
jgi:hypothetical protein